MEEIDKLDKAKEMYMRFVPITQIAKEIGVHHSTIQHHVRSKWQQERDLYAMDLLAGLTSQRKHDIQLITSSAVTILSKTLSDISKRNEPLPLSEARKVAEILTVLDKIARLDENKPTDITASEKVVEVVELKRKLALDPFATKEIDDATFEKID